MISWAPLLGAGYTAYQFGNIPGLDRLRGSIGGLEKSAAYLVVIVSSPWLPGPLSVFQSM